MCPMEVFFGLTQVVSQINKIGEHVLQAQMYGFFKSLQIFVNEVSV
jgi:hypothetical protein